MNVLTCWIRRSVFLLITVLIAVPGVTGLNGQKAFTRPADERLPVCTFQDADSLILSLINQTNLDSLTGHVRRLSGEDSVTVNDTTYLIYSRHTSHPHNEIAAGYIEQTLRGFGLPVFNQVYSDSGRNVYAVQEGTDFPEQKYLICAHYDDMPKVPPAPGADDNASGVAAVLEAARILSRVQTPYTIIYALWDEEEQRGIGSGYFAEQAASNEENILGVINLDMIGWDSDDDGIFDIHTRDYSKSVAMAEIIENLTAAFHFDLSPKIQYPGAPNSDHGLFWDFGYTAVALSEAYWSGDFNDYYHSSDDKIHHFNFDYFHSLSKLAIASVAHFSFYSIPGLANTNLSLVGFHKTPIRLVKVIDNFAFAATYDSLLIINLTDPNCSHLQSAIELPYITDFVIKGNFIYAVGGCGFRIIDITSKSFPDTVGSILDFCGEILDVSGNYVYSTQPHGVRGGCKSIINVTIPASPAWILHAPGGGSCISINHDKVYLSNLSIEVWDVSVPDTFSNPVTVEMDFSRPVNTMVIKDKKAFLSNDVRGFRIIDISDQINMQELAHFDEPGIVTDVAISGDYAYLACGSNGLRVVDISNVENPQGVGFYDTGGFINSVAADGDYIYAADEKNGLYIFRNDLVDINETKSYTLPNITVLEQNYPNPFNPKTVISYSLPLTCHADLYVYNILGQKVTTLVSEKQPAGSYKVDWDASGFASGVYLYKLSTDQGFSQTRKLVVIK